MVVQAISHENEQEHKLEKRDGAIKYIDIPSNIPNEVIENDSLLAIEDSMNKLEDKVVLTARSLLKMTNEMKIQLFEIERLEKTIIGMHKYMVRQNHRIEILESDLENIKNKPKSRFKLGTGFWAKLFPK
jgi:hypothetical protein